MNRTCILHHFAFLVWSLTRNFSRPILLFYTLKLHFLTTILPFLALFLMVLKGFVYTLAVDIYTFWLAFSNIFHCV